MSPWLSIVGIGEDGLAGLGAAARDRLDAAEVLVGGARHLAMVPEDGRERRAWDSPFPDPVAWLTPLRARKVVVLASGDPMWFGIGARLAGGYAPGEVEVLPHVSAFSLAAARLGWPLAGTACLSLHGRPGKALIPHITPGARLLVLSENAGTPGAVATRLLARGYGPSRVVVLERLGGPAERITEFTAEDLSYADDFAPDPLNSLAVECRPGPSPFVFPVTPGLADEAYAHDGQITKAEVRAVTLARLMPLPGALLWDVGAGAGSVAIEWMRAAPRARAIAIEPDPRRAGRLRKNAESLGVPGIETVEGRAPEAFAGLAAPDAAFLGGGLSGDAGERIVEAALAALRPGGRLVANAVTLASEARLLAAQAAHGGDLARIAVSRAAPVGRHLAWRPAMPVIQWTWQKPWGTAP